MQDNLKPQLVPPVLMYLPFSYFLDIWKVYWLMNGSGCGRPLLRASSDCFTSHLLHSSCPLLLNIRDTSAHCDKLFCVSYLHLLINWRIYSCRQWSKHSRPWVAPVPLFVPLLPPSLFLSRFFTTLWFCQMRCCMPWGKVKSFCDWLFCYHLMFDLYN